LTHWQPQRAEMNKVARSRLLPEIGTERLDAVGHRRSGCGR